MEPVKYFVQNNGTYVEVGEISEVDLSDVEIDEPYFRQPSMFTGGTISVDLTLEEILRFKRNFFPETINNWRRTHGMKPLRRKWINLCMLKNTNH